MLGEERLYPVPYKGGVEEEGFGWLLFFWWGEIKIWDVGLASITYLHSASSLSTRLLLDGFESSICCSPSF